jgi:hypothetical protein
VWSPEHAGLVATFGVVVNGDDRAELPGLKQDDVEIEVGEDGLTISG